MPVSVDWVVVSPFQSNCYLVACPTTREAIVIDPGDEAPRILALIDARGVSVKAIVATHGHLDHVLAVSAVKAATNAPFWMPEGDWELAAHAHELAALYGWQAEPVPFPDAFLREGDTVKVGAVTFTVLAVPGHSPDHIALYSAEPPGVLFCGDVLFAGSIGRTDLPGGDATTLQRSLQRLMALPDETVVYPGHGPTTTIGRERATNPFLAR